MVLTSHELARRLLQLPDHPVYAEDEGDVTGAGVMSYSTLGGREEACISLEVADVPEGAEEQLV